MTVVVVLTNESRLFEASVDVARVLRTKPHGDEVDVDGLA